MTADSRQQLAKAEQFLAAARLALGEELFDAAASTAGSAGIQATDAICSATVGRYSRARSHAEAVDLARTAGPEGRTAAKLLKRLLDVKSKAQYGPASVGSAAATRAVRTAEQLVELAAVVVR